MLKVTLDQPSYNVFSDVIALVAERDISINSNKSNLVSYEDVVRLSKIYWSAFNARRLKEKECTVKFAEEEVALLYRYFSTLLKSNSLEQSERMFLNYMYGVFDEYITGIRNVSPEVIGEINPY